MIPMKVWTILMVLICHHGNSDSQTDMYVTLTTEIMGTAPPTFGTPPPPPPPSIPPPPPSTSVEPTPTPTPEPPVTTRIPPPPPPPSPPPPPPSSVLPPSPTPSIPPTVTITPPTPIFTTTVAIEPTTPIIETTKPMTEEPIEPNPVAESLGKIGVLITGVALDQFDREQFKRVMAQEVNNYCAEYTDQCEGEGKTVSARDVVIVSAELYEQPEVNDGTRRKLLQETPILVEYYVQDPILSTNVMLTTEQQRVFLANEDVHEALERNIDGYDGIAPTYAEPIEDDGLEGWEIALIVIGSVAAAALVIGAIAWRMSYNKANSKHIDLELQDKNSSTVMEHTVNNDYATVTKNGVEKEEKKLLVDETDVSTQVKYKDIVAETGFEQTKVEAKPTKEGTANGGTSVTVTAEITSSSSGSSTSSDHGDTELEATAEDQQEIPPNYEPPQALPDMDSDNKEIQEEVTQVVNDLDKLVASQKEELTVNSAAFQNPGFVESTEPNTQQSKL